MPLFSRLLFPLLAALCVFSCAKDKGGNAKVSSLVVPTDEATELERRIIDDTLTDIEKLSSELGHSKSFRSIPVLVTSERPEDSGRFAACYSEDGQGKFIQVNRQVLRKEKEIFMGTTSTFFQILLHEIGHCYFGRKHLDDQIDVSAYRVVLPHEHSEKETEFGIHSVNASAMHSKNMIVPNVLKKYYVAEVIGLAASRDVPALQSYSPLTFTLRGLEPNP